ncbi:MAG: 2-oxoacid:ferredoxin oxidoreductase subunit gamma [Chloroflexi bacterium]|nr:2-oxoacid:ferredoxin oxidoreductase subunit gamma [Chloroflexota bacterium]
MKRRYEIRLAGEGGQGLILAGLILSEAAVLYDHKYAVQTQAYGPQVRGGISRSEVIIDADPIDYPLIIRADVLLALSQQACDRYGPELRPDGLLIADADLVSRVPCERAIRVPITALARETTGRAITANVLSLGLIAGLTAAPDGELVTIPALEQAIAARVPKGTLETNLLALHAGLAQAALWKKQAAGGGSLPEARGS